MKTAPGKPENVGRFPVQCTDIHSGMSTHNRKNVVVCCADRERSCAAGAPCHPESSLLTCNELGWDQGHNSEQVQGWAQGANAYHGRASVCASSLEPNDFGTSAGFGAVEIAAGAVPCQNHVNYFAAAEACVMLGARLCTAQELGADETRFSGCGFDATYVWSSTQANCGRNRVMQVVGSTVNTASMPPTCASMTDGEGAVRCCADATRMCFDEGSGAVDAAFYGQTGAPEPGGGCVSEESLSTCRELGWYTTEAARNVLARGLEDGAGLDDTTANTADSENVCAESELTFRSPGQVPGSAARSARGCMPAVDFKTALHTCVENNARLCTLPELLRDETRGSGCGHDSQRIWTSTIDECAAGEMKTGPGKSAMLNEIPVACTPIGESKHVYIRCCADAHRLCGGSTPCHPSSSLLTCDDLGWEEVTSSAMAGSTCDRMGCQNFAGSSSAVCGESEAMTGECHASTTFYEASNICLAVGARLCSADEIRQDETTFTGCGFDSHFVWTSSQQTTGLTCGLGSAVQVIGSSEMRNQPDRCQSMLAGNAAVRCCADKYRTCFSAGSSLDKFSDGACTADESLHTCGELGWIVGPEGQGVCGQSELGRSYGFEECPARARVVIPDVTCRPGVDAAGAICANANTPSPAYCTWRTNVHQADMFVCERCSIRHYGECFEEVDFRTALAQCVGIGARLCTQEELEADETRGTGCGLDNSRIWSSSRENCGPNEVVTVSGSTVYAGRHPTKCVDMSHNRTLVEAHGTGRDFPPAETVPIAIRCCADSSRTCSDGPCHPSSSLLTCAELSDAASSEIELWASTMAEDLEDRMPNAVSPGLSTEEVCAESDINGVCNYGTFTEAANVCMSVGARLCSIEELIGDETRYSGCGFDSKYVWSASQNLAGSSGLEHAHFHQCSDGEVLVARGSSEMTCEYAGGAACSGSQASNEAICVPLTRRDLNVAVGKPAFVDSVYLPDDGHPCDAISPDGTPGCLDAAKAVDGLVGNSNRWVSGDLSPSHWLAVDLQGVYPINSINLLSGHDHGTTPGTPDYDPRIGICTYDIQFYCNDDKPSLDCSDPGTSLGALNAAIAGGDDPAWVSIASGSDGPYQHLVLRTQPETERHVGQLGVEDGFELPLVNARYVRVKIDQSCDDGAGQAYANIARIYEFKVQTSIGVRCCADSRKMCSDLTCDDILEAEDAILGSTSAGSDGQCDPNMPSGPTTITRGDTNGARGTGFVQFNTPGDTIEWTLDSCTAGMHELDFRYSLAATNGVAMQGANRNEMSVEVSSDGVGPMTLPVHLHATGDWAHWATVTVHAQLRAGTNTVRLGVAEGDTGGGELPNVDWLQVALSQDTGALGTVCDAAVGIRHIPPAHDDGRVMSLDEVCSEDNVLRHDGLAAGLSYAGRGAGSYAGLPPPTLTRASNR